MRRAALAGLLAALLVPPIAHAHSVRVTVPAFGDVTLAQVRYAVPARRPAVRLALTGAIGAQYVAVATLRHQPRRALVVLVAVVNRRPVERLTPIVPQQIVLRLTPTRRLKAPTTTQSVDVLNRPPSPPPPACALGVFDPRAMRVAFHTGTAPTGFGVRSTIAQALAAACGRPVAPAFRITVAPPAPKCPPPCGPIEPDIICPEALPPICPQP